MKITVKLILIIFFSIMSSQDIDLTGTKWELSNHSMHKVKIRQIGYGKPIRVPEEPIFIEFKKKNKGKYLARQRKRWVDNDEKRAANKIVSQKHRTEMSDMYIKSLMTKKSKTLKPEDIPDELVNLYRENLKLKRLLKLTPKLKGEED